MVETLSQLILNTVRTYVKSDLLAAKIEGRYVTIPTEEVGRRIKHLSLGLSELGLGPGDKLVIFSENRPEWTMTDFAALCAGAVTVPIYTSLMPEQVKYIINDSDAGIVVCSNRELWLKVEAVRRDLPGVRHFVLIDEEGPEGIVSLSEVMARGKVADAANPGLFEKRALAVKPDDLASIIYTSGTTGVPKGVMLTHANFVSNAKALDAVTEFADKDVILSFLPLSHVLERMTTFSFLYKGASIYYAESIETVAENLLEVRPTIMISVPRLFDKIYAKVMDNVLTQSPLKRKIFFWAIGVGKKYGARRIRHQPVSRWLALQRGLAAKLVYGKIVEKTGGRVHFFVSGGAPLSGDVAEFFYAIGITILEGYGLTETSPVLTCNTFDRMKFGAVGPPVPGVEIKVAPDGEILAKGPNVMKGYYKKEQETREAFDEDGWLKTGDIGHFDEEGFLVITDRKKDILITAGGKNVAPQPIENLLKANPYIQSAVVVGGGRKFISALIVPDFGKLEAYARASGIPFGSRRELVAREEITSFMLAEVNRATPHLASYERIKKVVLVDREFDADTELTPSLKVKRHIVEKAFKPLIDLLYKE